MRIVTLFSLVFALMVALLATASAHASTDGMCTPQPTQVALFDGPAFTGNCVLKNVGDYPHGTAMNFTVNTLSSMMVGSQVTATVYRDMNYAGVKETFTASDPILADNPIGDNKVDSLRVQWRSCEPGRFQIAIYRDMGYQGQCQILNLGAYPYPEMTGLPDNSISSFRTGPDTAIQFYHDSLFMGASVYTVASTYDLNDNDNNRISSLRVLMACHPGENEVALFAETNYRGFCVVRGMGQYHNASQIGMPDNSISSIKIGRNVWASLFREPNFNNVYYSVSPSDDIPDLDQYPNVGNRSVSSLLVARK